MRKQVIVNADDFGYSDERNKGIVESFKFGVVSSVSLLVNGSSAREAIQLAQVNEMPLGLHLNLTEGLSIRKVKNTLTDDSGFFRGKMGFREALRDGRIDKLEVKYSCYCTIYKYSRRCINAIDEFVDRYQSKSITINRLILEIDEQSMTHHSVTFHRFLKIDVISRQFYVIND